MLASESLAASDTVIYRIRRETPFAVLFLNDFGKRKEGVL
jgi:hypothetical protein